MSDTSHLDSLLAYLQASPSPFHAVAVAAERLVEAGFRELAEGAAWTGNDVAARRFCIRGGALIAWDATDADPTSTGYRIVGAHTDSPNLRIKPRPDASNVGYRQLAVEVYGGVLANSWLDRDLGVSGRVLTAEGQHLVLIDRPLARVAQLAVHLDRDVNDKGLVLDRQLHLLPLIGLTGDDDQALLDVIASAAGMEASSILSHDLMLHDVTPPSTLGLQNEFVVSARIDNLFSCWAAITALTSGPSDGPRVVALFDHEEVGSSSTTGAGGPMLERVLTRINSALGLGIDQAVRAFAKSKCVSSDMAHAVHPNYADRHEPNHRPIPNGGPVIKLNVQQRYATDAAGIATFAAACERAGVPHQLFVSRNSQPCGSTIGPITATRLGIDTIDVGCAMLSMHSARELCGATDAALMVRALISFLGS